MILSDTEILKEIDNGSIIIDPFDRKKLGSNSYDVHLDKNLVIYENEVLDARKRNKVKEIEIPNDGLVLEPNTLYLGNTVEYTETLKHVPLIEGKSSIGRLGINIHASAGLGDVGFKGTWTLDITTTHKIKVYPNMPVGQLFYFKLCGEVNVSYDKKENAKYKNQTNKPIESMMWKNKF